MTSMYSGNNCTGTRGGNLSPALSNIYITDPLVQVEQSAPPGLILQDREVKFLLGANDLLLRSLVQHTGQYAYLCLIITTSRSFISAVKALK